MELLAKALASTCKRYLWWKMMESVWSILSLQDSASELELLELLCTLAVPKLKLRCKENATESSGNKADMISYCVLCRYEKVSWQPALPSLPPTPSPKERGGKIFCRHANAVSTPGRQDIESGGVTAP